MTELTPGQRRAIELRSGDVFLEAGAGTGKTRVLVERYCEAVCTDGVEPDRILAFTFTERAAAELRERVRRELVARARAARDAGVPARAAEIAAAARDSERAWITTIHGFCRRLLAIHPLAAGLDPQFRVLDDAEAERLGERAFATALEELVEAGDEGLAAFAAGYRHERLRDMVRGAYERLRSQGAERPALPDPGPPVRSLKAGEAGSTELAPAEASSASSALSALSALLEAYGDRYAELKAARSGADFEDLELRALALLRTPGPVREAWRDRFRHLMVDEFQDTNLVQLALVDALRGPEASLFVVGDEFQSIYRFRHADLEVFRERRQVVVADPDSTRLPLLGNFRSRPDVLAAINLVGATLLEGFEALSAGIETDSEAAGGGPAVELLLTDVSDDDKRSPSGWKHEDVALDPPPSEGRPASVAEARFLAERLRELADAGVPRGEMVVLLRAFTHVDAFEEALDRAGLAPYVVGGRGYWSQQQVEDVLRLLGAIANPLDDEVLFGALASPACGASPDALWLLRAAAPRPQHVWQAIERRFDAGEQADWLETLPPADAARLEAFCGTLAQLRVAAPLLPLDALIERTITAFDYDLALLARRDARRRMANVRKLMRLAREYEEHDGRDLRGFLDFAEERTARDEREGQAAVQVEGHDGVRIMTVHAAKGLQFPVVAVADMGRGLDKGYRTLDIAIGRLRELGDSSGAALGMRLALPAQTTVPLWRLHEIEAAEKAAEAEEACRLVHVAATRAEDRLILSGTYKPKELERCEPRPGDTALARLLPALTDRGWDGGAGEVGLNRPLTIAGAPSGGPAPRLRIRISRPSHERAAELRLAGLAERAVPEAATVAEAPAPLLEGQPRPVPVGHLSYSALDSYSRCRYRFYVERVIGLRSALNAGEANPEGIGEPAPEPDELLDPDEAIAGEVGLAIGRAVHAALEWSARHGWAEPEARELEAVLVREGLARDGVAVARVEELVASWLGCDLRRRLDSEASRLRPEASFVLALGGTVVRGKIDLLAELGEGRLLVVDYKTNALGGADPAALAAGYETQRDIYALAVHESQRNGSPLAVETAYCFLEEAGHAVTESYDEARLQEARRRLEGLVAGMREGDFTRTEAPHRSLCYGCPAAARLCGKPAWRPERAGAAAT